MGRELALRWWPVAAAGFETVASDGLTYLHTAASARKFRKIFAVIQYLVITKGVILIFQFLICFDFIPRSSGGKYLVVGLSSIRKLPARDPERTLR